MTLNPQLFLVPALLAVSLSAQPALEPLDEPGYQRLLAERERKPVAIDSAFD